MSKPSKSGKNHQFTATIELIGINPFVTVPQDILTEIFRSAGKATSPIPIHGKVNGKAYRQSLVKYAGDWRLYINATMLANSPRRIGEQIIITVAFDNKTRVARMHPALKAALVNNPAASKVYKSLPPSLQAEIKNYISRLKTASSIEVNTQRAIDFLLGKERFIGRPPISVSNTKRK